VALRWGHLAGFDAAWRRLQDGRDRRDASGGGPFHISASTPPLQMGIDTTDGPYRNHIYIRSALPGLRISRMALAPAALAYDRWYSWGSSSSGALVPTGSSSGGEDGHLLADGLDRR
jgi:hypothetical protein